MPETVEVLVAQVLDAYRVALNHGSDAGIGVGDKVTIWRLVDVTDPSSGETLGSVRLDKLALTVSMVDSRYSVASVNTSGSFGNITFFGARKRIRTGSASGDADVVDVRAGDEATVYLRSDEES